MQSTLFVMAGGALGAAMRFQLGRLAIRLFGPGWPWGTFAANILGGLLMGVLVGILARTGGGENWRLFVGVGLLGGFTTFSSFSLEAVNMIERGDWSGAAIYVGASAAGAILALFAGLWLVRLAA